MDTERIIKIAIIGLGARGSQLLRDVFIPMCEEGIEICAVCDLYEDRANDAAKMIEEKGYKRPLVTCDYKEAIALQGLEAVIVATAWESHVKIATDSMKAGLHVGLEVGGAYALEDCWALVNTHEETGRHCMMLENCCYGQREMMVLNMVRSGVLGSIVHCEGGYHHCLQAEVTNGMEGRHYRLRNYINRNCENYPTHELGPIAKILDINNGNRMLTLNSVASCSRGMHEFILYEKGEHDRLSNIHFNQGDIITTIIKCQNGETITLTLDTTLPRAYSRGFTVRGTKGAYFEDTDSFYIDHTEHGKFHFEPRGLWGNAEQFEAEYNHPVWQNYTARAGHDGMDWLVDHAFFEAIRKGVRPPIDTYDTASYMCVSVLSEQSIACGGATMYIPDFTRGKWYQRTDIADLDYNLDRIKPYLHLYQDK